MKLCICIYTILLIILYKKRNIKQPLTSLSIENTKSLKGLLALSIILHHFSRSIQREILDPFNLFTDIGVIMVGGFLFISGYGLIDSYLKNRTAYLHSFLSKRLKKITIPFFVSIMIFQTLQYLLTSQINVLTIYNDLLKGETTHLLPHSWYIFMIIYFYISYYFIMRCKIQLSKKIVLILLSTLIYSYIVYSMNWGAYWYLSTPLFLIGIIYRLMEKSINLLINEKIWILYTNIILIAFLSYSLSPIFRSISLSIFLIVPFLQFALSSKVLRFLGKISYEMYLLQGVVFYAFRNKELYITNNYIYLITCISTLIIIANMQHLITNSLINFKRSV